MRAGVPCAIASLTAALAAGCTTLSAYPVAVALRAADGPLWLHTDEIDRFRCDRGILVCMDAIGRGTKRLCRCTQ